ncbi:SURF1 family protein [Tropicimonas sp.]|uniref:SURF1 family protein n=1 Tax=Tropicimonas sp. TaxID=2067044 RepID=UPI003A8746F5
MRYLFALIVGAGGVAVLLALGVWQMQRLHWKEAILDEIDSRIAADPVPLPAAPDSRADRYLPVRVEGRTGARELHVLVSTRDLGPGFRIVTSLDTDSGRRILLDRGFVAANRKNETRLPTHVAINGNLHWPDERDGFTPENDVGGNFWYARDVAEMARALGAEPVLVVARDGGGGVVTPLPVDSAGIPNNHLGYAVQWFGLAAVWAGMTLLLLRRMARRTPESEEKT